MGKPVLECPNPFMRIKTAVNEKEYTQLCHVVLELETYMLEQKKLPTDFDQVAPNLKAALSPSTVFAQDYHKVPNYQSTQIEEVMGGYSMVDRLEKMENKEVELRPLTGRCGHGGTNTQSTLSDDKTPYE